MRATFPIVKKRDEAAHGTYRTKDTILQMYDETAEAIRTGKPYETHLDPPPGPPTDAAGNFIPMSEGDPANWPPTSISHVGLSFPLLLRSRSGLAERWPTSTCYCTSGTSLSPATSWKLVSCSC